MIPKPGHFPKWIKLKDRDSNGKFYPSFLEQGLRSESALKISLAEMYIQGFSTRKVNAILSELCGFEVTSSEVSRAIQELDVQLEAWRNRELGYYVYLILDARYEKVREGGCRFRLPMALIWKARERF